MKLPGDISNSVTSVRESLARHRCEGSRGYYAPALRLALHILAEVRFSADIGTVPLDGQLTNSNALFENYVRRVLLDTHRNSGLLFEKEQAGVQSLYLDGVAGVEPDILVKRGTQVVSVGDAKYKGAIENSDHYQLCSYLRHYGTSRGFLLSATDVDRPTQWHRTPDKLEIAIVYLPLTNLDLADQKLAALGREGKFEAALTR